MEVEVDEDKCILIVDKQQLHLISRAVEEFDRSSINDPDCRCTLCRLNAEAAVADLEQELVDMLPQAKDRVILGSDT